MPGPKDAKDATHATCAAHARLRESLPAPSQEDFENSTRGFIATIPDARIVNEAGHPVWELTSFAFEDEETPTVKSVLDHTVEGIETLLARGFEFGMNRINRPPSLSQEDGM